MRRSICLEGDIPDTERNAVLVPFCESNRGIQRSVVMGLLGKLCEFVGKIVCKGVWSVCKFVWKIGYALYRQYKEKKAANGGNSDVATVKSHDVLGPDESVLITGKEKFANLTDDELRLLLEKMTDNAVKVDAHPELE